jgi:hypothetical protein
MLGKAQVARGFAGREPCRFVQLFAERSENVPELLAHG